MAAATPKFVFLTYATKRFLPSLDIWLKYNGMQAKTVGAEMRVYLGADVDSASAPKVDGVNFKELPSQVPEGAFEDYWAAQHYAWKLWILRHECTEANTVYIYSDCATVMVRFPEQMIRYALEDGISFVEDTTQINRHWFSDDFKKELAVTIAEQDANQIQAATIVCTSAGRPLLEEAYKLSLRRSVIAGPKWAGILPSGQPFGHRHDQAILSLLRIRMGVKTVPIGVVQNSASMKDAFESGAAFYVHRGAFTMSKDVLPLISDVMLVNLARRKDRLDTFATNHPDLKDKVSLHVATDGRALKMTPAIARVLRPNDFFWKKAVAGCALSHLGLWYKLANSGPDVKSYLILEDDVKMAADWKRRWAEAAPQVPADWDVLYLGGVLPPNWPAVDRIKEHVAGPWYRVAPNQIFGQREPTRYFHFCTYAYVVSKAGAQKIMKMIEERDGFFTSADHIMCNHFDRLNMYFADPKIAGCIQEDDPAYCQSQFNDFSRIDKFDSDLWNNDERFSMEERAMATGPLDIRTALLDIQAQQMPAAPAEGERNLLVRMLNGAPELHDSIMEIDWLEEMMDCKIHIRPMVKTNSEFEANEVPWVLVSRQDLDTWIRIFNLFASEGREFYAIHLSDEFCRDDISWYKLPNCKGVIRNYWRPDADAAHVITIPLGFAKGTGKALRTKRQRNLVWAFHGTGWFGRREAIEHLKDIKPNNCNVYDNWNDPAQLGRYDYAALIGSAAFVPCMRGNHFETFRMYETLEAGSIPIYVRSEGDETYWNWLRSHLPLLNIGSWAEAAKYMRHFRTSEDHMAKYQNGIMLAWIKWKDELKAKLRSII